VYGFQRNGYASHQLLRGHPPGSVQGAGRGLPQGWKESLNGKNWELTTWFRVTAWRNLAAAVNQYLEKG